MSEKETLYVVDGEKYGREQNVKAWQSRILVVAANDEQSRRIDAATRADAWDVDRVLMNLARVHIMHGNNIHSMREHFNVVMVDNPQEARLRYEAEGNMPWGTRKPAGAAERVLASRKEGEIVR